MFVLDLFNTKYEKELREGAVDKVVSEGGPYDLPGKDYPRPGDAPRRPRSSGGPTPRRHDDDPDFMDPDQRRLRADQARVRKANAEYQAKKKPGVAEETDSFGGYKQSPRAFGVGNFQRIVRANMGNLPTVTLEFANPDDTIILDKKGIDLISDYYDELKTDAIKNHFIYRVLPSGDEVLTVLKKLGWNQAVQPELPGIPRQGELPLQEKKKFNPNSDVVAGDVKVARELQKLRAQYPAAKSDVEAVAKAEIDSSERSQQQLSAINGANTEQDQLLKQLVALDQKQGKEIGSLDNENDRLEQQLKHVEKTNAKLAQAIGQMGRETPSKGADDAEPTRSKSVNLAPVDAPAQLQAKSEPSNAKTKSDAINRMAQDLTQPRKVQGIDQGPAPDIRGTVTNIDQYRNAQAAVANRKFEPLAKAMVNKGVLSRTGTDEGLLDFVTKKQPVTKTKPEPVDPMIAKIVSNRLNPQSRVPRAKAKVYHGYDEYNRAKSVGDVEESTVNEFAPGQGGSSGNYFQALASAWYNGTFNTGSLQKGIKSQQDVERLLNRGIVCPDGKTRKLHIDYNSDFDGVEIYSDDYYEHGDLDGNDGRTGQPWGPYDFMTFSDDQLDESVVDTLKGAWEKVKNFDSPARSYSNTQRYQELRKQQELKRKQIQNQGMAEGTPISTTPNSIDPGGAVDNFKQQMANNTELAYQKGMAEARKKKKKKSSRSLGRYFFPGYGYYGGGESGEGGGDGGGGEGESVDRAVAEGSEEYCDACDMVITKKPHVCPGSQGMAEGTDDPFGPQGRFVGDTGPTQITKTVPRVQLRIGDPVLYKPTEQRATIEALSKDGTKARIHISSPMGGRIFNCMVADLKALEALKGNINELSTDKLAQYKTAAALDAGAADKRGDYERGDKRFAGIVKATKKQFANDLKKHKDQDVAESLMKEPTTRKEYLDQRDRLFRMMAVDSNPANKQIIKQALQDLETRYGNLKNTVKEESSTASDAVERAILNRIMVAHTDLLMKFGPDKVMQAAEEVAYNVGDVDEIGTSDVSAYVNQVKQILGVGA